MNQAIEFNDQIKDMIDDVEAAIQQGSNEEEQAAIKAKREEVSVDHESLGQYGFLDQFISHVIFGTAAKVNTDENNW